MLWHLEDTNLHLMASIHALEQSRHALFSEAEQIYRKARRVTFEHDPVAPPDPVFIENPPGKPLSTQVPSAVFARVVSEWERLGLPLARLEQIQPWVAAMNIGVAGAAARGISPAHGVEGVLWGRTERDGKTRTTLEEQADALAAFSTSPDHERVSFLDYAVNPPTALQNDFDIMIQAWHDHDDRAIEHILDHRLRSWPIGFEKLCAGRNRAWIPKIVDLTADRIPTLVVVGALHCVGAAGIPKLLEEQGARVSRVI